MTIQFPSRILVAQNTNTTDHLAILADYLKTEFQLKLTNSPQVNIYNQEAESLKIKTVRQVIDQASFASFHNKTRFFAFLYVHKATIPAQNALLKLIEEPPANTYCLLITNQLNKLLPTIKSRCLLVHPQKQTAVNKNQQLPDFLTKLFQNPTAVTFSDIIEWAGEHKDRSSALQILNESLLAINNSNTAASKKIIILQELSTAIKNLEANFNTKLSLEKALFSIKNSL